MAKPYKRRKLIVDNLQYRLLIAGIIYFATVVFVFACGVFIPVIIQLESGGVSYEALEAANHFLVLHERVWPPLILAFILLIVHSIMNSHRIAGPLYRIRTVLNSVGSGDLTQKITLRKKDYLKKEADNVNTMVTSLREKIDRLQSHSTAASDDLTALKQSLQSGSSEAIRRQTDRLTVDIDRLVQCLGEFKTRNGAAKRSEGKRETGSPQEAPETVGSAS